MSMREWAVVDELGASLLPNLPPAVGIEVDIPRLDKLVIDLHISPTVGDAYASQSMRDLIYTFLCYSEVPYHCPVDDERAVIFAYSWVQRMCLRAWQNDTEYPCIFTKDKKEEQKIEEKPIKTLYEKELLNGFQQRSRVADATRAAATVSKKFGDMSLKMFPVVKSFAGARSKTNFTVEELVLEGKSGHAVQDPCAWGAVGIGATLSKLGYVIPNDAMAAATLYASCLGPKLPCDRALVAVTLMMKPSLSKELSNVFKTLGWSHIPEVAALCEANVLCGRGIGEVNLNAKVRERTTQAWVKANNVHIDELELRRAIREVLAEEMGPETGEREPLLKFFSRRWAWFVNGAHSCANEERAMGEGRVRRNPFEQHYRREFGEAYRAEELSHWDGRVYASGSLKLEHGKTRLLLACDSVSYMHFSYILNRVERRWNNRRCVLEPGNYGSRGIKTRCVGSSRPSDFCNVMLDYDDFNSQHENQAMAMVFEELGPYFPDIDVDKYAESFNQTFLTSGDVMIGRNLGGLCSGHRATTFVNTVLNRAYILAVARNEVSGHSTHIGDDIHFACPSTRVATKLVHALINSPLRMNPSKQSLGRNMFELLRVSYGDRRASAYMARCIASLVSGNWTTLSPLGEREYLSSITNSAWTLFNRSRGSTGVLLMAPVLSKRCNLTLSQAEGLLRGDLTYAGGIVRASKRIARALIVQTDLPTKERAASLSGLADHATTEYGPFISPVERLALEMTHTNSRSILLNQSYSKSMGSEDDASSQVRVVGVRRVLLRPGKKSVAVALREPEEKGLLNHYPLVSAVKSALTGNQVRQLLQAAYGEDYENEDAFEIAFNDRAPSETVARGFISFVDLSLAKKRGYGYIYSDGYDMFV
uniref:RNA-directed RNA polymerase n=1 Tax=Phytophthora palustris toti-like virus 6 TaxID=2976318 RepID=A0A9E8Z131_9VIRU|nr:RNA-dependent RNA polymerase [Phytophthora palustris toti-like virus 6]